MESLNTLHLNFTLADLGNGHLRITQDILRADGTKVYTESVITLTGDFFARLNWPPNLIVFGDKIGLSSAKLAIHTVEM